MAFDQRRERGLGPLVATRDEPLQELTIRIPAAVPATNSDRIGSGIVLPRFRDTARSSELQGCPITGYWRVCRFC